MKRHTIQYNEFIDLAKKGNREALKFLRETLVFGMGHAPTDVVR